MGLCFLALSNYTLRGLFREKSGDKKGAVEDFSSAIKIDSNLVCNYLFRADAYCKLGNELLCAKDYFQASLLDPRSSWKHFIHFCRLNYAELCENCCKIRQLSITIPAPHAVSGVECLNADFEEQMSLFWFLNR